MATRSGLRGRRRRGARRRSGSTGGPWPAGGSSLVTRAPTRRTRRGRPRTDMGRARECGGVAVEELLVTEEYAHVSHILSNVTGRLRKDRDAFDLLRASFPAGTLSGAPKIRAMEIIDELEPVRRGVYGGTLGYFDLRGMADFCIAIRTLLLEDGRSTVPSGSGIRAGSAQDDLQPETEATV